MRGSLSCVIGTGVAAAIGIASQLAAQDRHSGVR